MRPWKDLNRPRLYGSDNEFLLLKRYRVKLAFAEFSINKPNSPFHYENEKFDLIYAISVFAHLTEAMGTFWKGELCRVLKPSGIMCLTFMGTTRAPGLCRELRKEFESEQLVVTGEEHAGRIICAAFHPEQDVRTMFARGFRVPDSVLGGATGAFQDVHLLQKRNA